MRRVTAEVLGRPEFADARPAWWERLLGLLAEGFARVIELVGGGNRGSIVGTVVLVGVCAVLGFAAVRFIRKVGRDARSVPRSVARERRSPAQWWDDAGAAERQGRFREALRCGYRGLLAELAAAGLVEEVAGRTTGEYAAEVAEHVPSAGSAFAGATRRFEAVWYGQARAGAEDVAAFARQVADVRDAAGLSRRPVGTAT